jgi:hypothetical protein
MRYLQDAHEINKYEYRAEPVCPSVRRTQLEEGCTDFDEI